MNPGSSSSWLVRHLAYSAASLLLLEGIVRFAIADGIAEFGREQGPLEYLHIGLQAGSVALFALAAAREGFGSRVFALAAYAAALGVVREADAYLDHALFRGAYKIPAAILGGLALRDAWRHRRVVAGELAAWVQTPSFLLAALGAFVVLGFAQIAGQKELWQALMGDGYQRGVKDAAEELLELLGYLLIFFSAVETYWLSSGSPASIRRANERDRSGAGKRDGSS